MEEMSTSGANPNKRKFPALGSIVPRVSKILYSESVSQEGGGGGVTLSIFA